MRNYMIRARIEMEECDENDLNRITENKDRGFEINLKEKDARRIDNCGQALSKIDHKAGGEVVYHHLSAFRWFSRLVAILDRYHFENK